MAKRFIDTGFLEQKWIRKLSPERKIFLIYLMLKCDNGGIIELDMEDVEFWIGKKIGDPLKFLPEGYLILIHDSGKYFMPKFIEWQYPNFPHSKVHQQAQAKDILIRNGIFDIDAQSINICKVYVKVMEDLPNIQANGNANVNGNVNGNVKKEEKANFDFSFLDEGWEELFMDWIDYKKSIKDNYNTQKSIEACYRNLKSLSLNELSTARRIIDQSIGNKYKGLFPLKEAQKSKDDLKVSTKYL